jgi:hypothetical protein
MKIHTDTLTRADLWHVLPQGCFLEISEHGSRQRDHAFKVGIGAEHGSDAHGIKRAFARNSGRIGSAGEFDRAATWVEWGDWMVALFKLDPRAIIGYYASPEDFVTLTTRAAEHRPPREHAKEHAARWRDELNELVIA